MRTLSLSLFLLLFWTANALGQIAFKEHVFTEDTVSVVRVRSVVSGDIDGDGDIDIVSASYDDDKIAWFENGGDETYEKQYIISESADGAYSVRMADLDADGDLDIVAIANLANKVFWYENDGMGVFEEHIVDNEATSVTSVAIDDLNGDGKLDIVVALNGENNVVKYENNGRGGFVRSIVKQVDGVFSICTGDIDKDGDIDIFATSYSGNEVVWLEYIGNDYYYTHTVAYSVREADDIELEDIDGDGYLDVVVTAATEIIWYKKNRIGTSFQEYSVGIDVYWLEEVSFGDFDNDGDKDIVVASHLSNVVYLYENEGGGSSFTQRILSDNVAGANSVNVNDIDRDGDLDVVSASWEDQKIAWHENNGLANFKKHDITSIEGYYALDIKDADKDGDLDVIMGSAYSDKVFWLINQGDKTFKKEEIDEVVDGPTGILAEDLDNNGHIDFIVGAFYQHTILYYANQGNGKYTKYTVSTNARYIRSLSSGDFDGDGKLDIVSASDGDDKIAWYKYNTNGTFTERVISSNADGAYYVDTGDFDGDGDLDVVSASVRDNKIAWYINNGFGSFQERIISEDAIGAFCVETGDMDSDGDLDILSASIYDNKVAWYKNDGTGNFEERLINGEAIFPRYVIARDMDGDGDLDAMSTSALDETVAWYENDGTGSFLTYEISLEAGGAYALGVNDFDGDSDMDVIATSFKGDRIAWYEQVSLDANLTGIADGTLVSDTFTLTIELNLEVEGLSLEDLDVTNGVASNLQKVEGTNNYTVDITPEEEGQVDVKLKEDTFYSVEHPDILNNEDELYVIYDGTPPRVTSVDVPAPKTYREGEEMYFTVFFDEDVILDGEATLTTHYNRPDGEEGVLVAELSSSESNALTFVYTVKQGDEDLDGVELLVNGLSVTDELLKDEAGNKAILDLNNIGDLSEVFMDANANTPSISGATTDEDEQTTEGLVITKSEFDTEEVTHFQVTGITDGKLYLIDGITEIKEGDFITAEQAQAGLKFTPDESFSGIVDIYVQSSLRANASGLGGEKAQATITVNEVNDLPELIENIENLSTHYGDINEIDLKLHFIDIEDAVTDLTYTAVSSDGGIVEVVVESGVLSLTSLYVGEVTVDVTVTDLDGGEVSTQFIVTVSPADLVVTPNNKRREFNFENPALNGVIEGLQFEDKLLAKYYTEAVKKSEAGTYPIIVSSAELIEGEWENYVLEKKEGELEIYSINRLFIPNLFTPNGDGNNDVFRVKSFEVATIQFKIYDTFGVLLFESNSVEEMISTGWDGNYQGGEIAAGNYVWQMTGTFLDGSELSFEGKNTGVVALVR